MDTILLDHRLQESLSFTDPSFPIKYYEDNLNRWADHQVPLHWHFGYEFFSAGENLLMSQYCVYRGSACADDRRYLSKVFQSHPE